MKSQSLAACLATIVIAVGGRLDADIQTDGPKIRPPDQQLRVGDATVSVQLDRGVVAAGSTASAILVATADRPHAVTVDVTTLEDMGFGEGRVQNPPFEVDRRKLVVQAQPGGGPPVVASIVLGNRRAPKGMLEWYEVLVTRHGTHVDPDDTAARLGIAGWSSNAFAMTIEPPATMPLEGPFIIAVRIKNTTKAPFEYLQLSVGGRIEGYDSLDGELGLASDDYDVSELADEASADEALAPGAEKVTLYKVTPKRGGIDRFTFVAHARSGGRGALDVVTFDRPEPAVERAVATR